MVVFVVVYQMENDAYVVGVFSALELAEATIRREQKMSGIVDHNHTIEQWELDRLPEEKP